MEEEKSPTFELRKICEKIESKINERLGQLNFAVNESTNEVNVSMMDNYKSSKLESSAEGILLEKLKDDLCRLISSSLPEVVSYETKVNDKIEDLKEELEECQKQMKKEKQNFKDSILERDKLKLEILEFEHQNKELSEDLEIMKEKYNEAITLCGKYMKEIRALEAEKVEEHEKIEQKEQLEDQMKIKIYNPPKSNKNLTLEIPQYQEFFNSSRQEFSTSKKSNREMNFTADKLLSNREINFPLQIKEKLNEAEKVLTRSPRSNDPHLESSHFQLSTEIVGCQKELLEIELRESEKEKAQLLIELEEERVYSQKLEREAINLEKLLDGEKKLNEKLDRELYLMINSSKEMKIELLEERAKTKQLEEEIYELEEQASLNAKETTELQTKITELEMTEKNMSKLEEEVQEAKENLTISEKKYEELRKIKQELENKIEDFEEKLEEIEKKELEDEHKNQLFHSELKSENLTKIKQIEAMTTLIKEKYQQKLNIVQKQSKEIKEKYKFIKEDNNRLYEALDLQVKKELKFEEKCNKLKNTLEQAEEDNKTLKKDKEILEEKLKTQSLLCKELKRELNLSEKSQQFNERKLKRLQISLLPTLISEIKSIKEQALTIKTSVIAYKEMILKVTSQNCSQIEQHLSSIAENQSEKLSALNCELHRKSQIIDQMKNESHISEQQKLHLLERNTTLETKERNLSEELTKKDQQISEILRSISTLEEKNKNLFKELEMYKEIEKNSMEKIETLRSKQKEVESFYDLVDELSKENEKLKQKLDKLFLKNHQHHSQKSYEELKYTNFSPTAENDTLSYMIPQRMMKEKHHHSRSKETLLNKNPQIHSCFHHRPVSNNKSSILMEMQKSPSLEKKTDNQNKFSTSYEHTLPYNLPINSRPIEFNSRKVVTSPVIEKFQTQNSLSENPLFYDEEEKMKYDFENQRSRLENIRNEYERLMVDKFRDELIEKRQI